MEILRWRRQSPPVKLSDLLYNRTKRKRRQMNKIGVIVINMLKRSGF